MGILLPISEGQIRLLRILDAKEEINCDVQVFDLSNIPKDGYFALSYCWGTGAQPMHITLQNAEQLNVTTTLHSALRELHRKEEIRGAWHWVDQICIDQENKAEKTQQVKAMDKVFGLAKRVLIWLGEASPDSDLAMDNLTQLITQMGDAMPTNYSEKEAIHHRLLPRDHPVWKAIVNLYARPWFRRVWILQESVLANGSFVLCGDRTLTWTKLVDFANKIMAVWPGVLGHAGQNSRDDRVSGFVSCSQMGRFAEMRNVQHISVLNILLTTTRDREAGLPIDYIYGITALVPETYRSLIQIDYELPYEQAAIQFCKAYVQVDSFLNLIGMAASRYRPEGLPSWCPHFGSPPLDKSKIYSQFGCMAGFLDFDLRESRITVSETGDNSITVPGFRVDVVKHVAERWFELIDASSAAAAAVTAAANLQWMQECETLLQTSVGADNPITPDQWETYARTLVAGHYGAIEPVPLEATLHEAYTTYKNYLTDISRSVHSTFSSPDEQNLVLKFGIALALQEGRRMFMTEQGRVGLGPSRVREGDVVAVFYSGASLWALRFDEVGEKATLVGDAFMEGFMKLERTPDGARGRDEGFVIV